MKRSLFLSGVAWPARTEVVSDAQSSPRSARCAIFIALAVLLQSNQPAHAQLLDQLITTDIPGLATEAGVTVLSRSRPAYESLGVRLGNFTIRPELRSSIGYDDNVLGTTRAKGSAFVETDARMRLDYEQSQVTGSALLSVDDTRYLTQSKQSFTNWAANLAGTYAFGRDKMTVSFDHYTLNQTPRTLDTPQLDTPIQYQLNVGKIAYKAMFNRVFIQPAVSLAAFDYDNGTVAGARYLQTYRNRVVVMPSLTFGYELSTNRNLVLVVRDAVADYSTAFPNTAKRNFNDAAVLAGIDYDVDGIWRYRVLAGYESRSFTSRQYKTIQAPVVEAAVIWSPTGLTTVTALLTRHIQDSTEESIAAYTETGVRLRVDHELRRDVLLQGFAGLYQDSYSQGLGDQSLYRVGASANWLISRNVQLIGAYDFTARRTDRSRNQNVTFGQQRIGTSYNDNRFILTLRLAL